MLTERNTRVEIQPPIGEDFDSIFRRYVTKSDIEDLKLRSSPPPRQACRATA